MTSTVDFTGKFSYQHVTDNIYMISMYICNCNIGQVPFMKGLD